MTNHWLMKTEPNTFSIDDLKKVKKEPWDGVRNYQARNFMRDDMKKGDRVLFYHSNCDVPGVVGLAEVSKESFPDFTAFDKKSNYYDPKSDEENPRGMMVEVKFKKKLKRTISLSEMKEAKPLAKMRLVQKGNRLSIMPVSKKEYDFILKLAEL
jgi:predicted RNA-binding protein with PUA-like domain